MRGDFVVVTHPDRQPAVDFITRSAQGPFIDTGVDVLLRSRPGEPVRTERVYLAKDTVAQLARELGIVADDGTTAAREASLIAQGKIEGMKEALGERLGDVVRDLGRTLDALADGGAHAGGVASL